MQFTTTKSTVNISLADNSEQLGDVNGDSKINTKDARVVLRYVAKLEELSKEQQTAADCNKDGKINTKDARKILRVVAKLENM